MKNKNPIYNENTEWLHRNDCFRICAYMVLKTMISQTSLVYDILHQDDHRPGNSWQQDKDSQGRMLSILGSLSIFHQSRQFY